MQTQQIQNDNIAIIVDLVYIHNDFYKHDATLNIRATACVDMMYNYVKKHKSRDRRICFTAEKRIDLKFDIDNPTENVDYIVEKCSETVLEAIAKCNNYKNNMKTIKKLVDDLKKTSLYDIDVIIKEEIE